jgi:uncharacterized protein (TIGR00369 family)
MTKAPRTWATQRLDELVSGQGAILPPVIQTLRLGALDEWGVGWIRKRWQPHPDLLNVDGSLFGGYIAALADQALAFAAMTVVPADSVFRTTNLYVNFIRVGRAHPLAIEAVVVAQTRQMLTVRATLKREDGELIAEASAQQTLQAYEEVRQRHREPGPNNTLEPSA